MAVTAATVKLHVETDLADAQVTRLINDAAAEISLRFGSDTSRTEQFMLSAPRRRLFLRARASSIGEGDYVKEGFDLDNLAALAAADYHLAENGWVVEKDGADFLPRVEVKYTPVSDSDRRDRVTIDLVRLAIQYSALSSLGDGDHKESGLDYQAERERLLSTLQPAQRAVA